MADPEGSDSNPAARRVVFLFGTSSVGKTSTAVELQDLLAEPYLLIGLDTFFHAWPSRWSNGGPSERDGFRYERADDGGLVIRRGPAGERLLAGARSAVHALAASGTNVIYDEMPIHDGVLPAWRKALADLDVLWVRLTGDPNVIDEREAARHKAKYHGLARGHAHLIDDEVWADLTLDATASTPAERAAHVARAIAP